jgi:Beta-lactamase enzyme family
MTAFLRERAGSVTAAVYNVKTGRLFVYRPGVHEDEASIAKVDILATLLHERGAPLAPPDSAAAAAAIDDSDNDAAQDLWNAAGGDPAIAAFNSAAGLTHTLLDPRGVWGHDETTAADQIRLLRTLISPNPLLPAPARRYELALMGSVTPPQAWGVSAGVLAPATVALKNGWLTPDNETGWQVNSIGIVHGRYRHYLLAVLTSGDPGMAYGVATIEGISRLVWRYLLPRRFRPHHVAAAGSPFAKRETRSTSAPTARAGARP